MKRETLETAEIRARRYAKYLNTNMPLGWGFVLILVSFEGDKKGTYISNCDRETIPAALREFADKIERKDEI